MPKKEKIIISSIEKGGKNLALGHEHLNTN